MPAAGHVLTARLQDVLPGADGGPLPGLAEFLAAVPDHRRAQGRRHSMVSVLTLACAAVAAGARSLVPIAEWAADAPGHVLDSLGVRRDPCGGALVVPSETTIRRALCDTDPDALDEQLAAWAAPAAPQDDEVPAAQVMVDGKSLRGALQADGRPVHLLAAMSGAGAVLAQREVGHKTNEITQVRPLLDPLCLDGAVITLDALHCQRETARFIVEDKHADYIFTAVKDNQSGLFDTLDALPWQDVQVGHVMKDRGHGRDETRTIQVLPAPTGIFPHADHAFLIERHVADLHGNPVSDIAARHHQHDPQARHSGCHRYPCPRALGNREQAALCPGRQLRRRRLPRPHQERAAEHGRHAQPGYQRTPCRRLDQYRRRTPLDRKELHEPAVTAKTLNVRTPNPCSWRRERDPDRRSLAGERWLSGQNGRSRE
jgi:predicted transposase YbfD/YdcC